MQILVKALRHTIAALRAPRASTDRAHARWHAALRESNARKHRGQLESIHASHCRCFLGHACHALGIRRWIGTVDDVEHVFYGSVPEPWADSELPDEAARRLDITPLGDFSHPVPMRGRDGQPVQVSNVGQMNDDTEMTPAQAADWLTANRALLLPYGTHVERSQPSAATH